MVRHVQYQNKKGKERGISHFFADDISPGDCCNHTAHRENVVLRSTDWGMGDPIRHSVYDRPLLLRFYEGTKVD